MARVTESRSEPRGHLIIKLERRNSIVLTLANGDEIEITLPIRKAHPTRLSVSAPRSVAIRRRDLEPRT